MDNLDEITKNPALMSLSMSGSADHINRYKDLMRMHKEPEVIEDCVRKVAKYYSAEELDKLLYILQKENIEPIADCLIEITGVNPELRKNALRFFKEKRWARSINDIADQVKDEYHSKSFNIVIQLMSYYHNYFGAIEQYENTKPLVSAMRMIKNSQGITRHCNYYNREIREILDPYNDSLLIYNIFTINLFKSEDAAVKVANGLTRYNAREARKYSSILRWAAENGKDCIAEMVDAFEKYDLQVLHQAFVDCNLDETNFEELLTDKAANAVKKSRNPLAMIKRIMTTDYTLIREMLCSRTLGQELSYDDLDLISNSLDLVKKIHKERDNENYEKVIKGYFSELNRAIHQGHDFKSYVRNIQIYCSDVEKQMRDNAQELMVVHNA